MLALISEKILSQFGDAMRGAGVHITSSIIADGRLHRYNHRDDHRSRRNVWATLHLDSHPAGVFGDLKRMGSESVKWSATGTKRLSVEERRAMMAKIKADTERREKAKRAASAAVAVKANEIWNSAQDAENTHPYLRKKGIQAHGLRVTEWVRDLPHDKDTGEVNELRVPNTLLVPIKNASKEIVSLQAIFPGKHDGIGRDKDFLPGGQKRGCYYAFGLNADNSDKPIILAEGFATAASLHEATGFGCVVCFDAGNLKPVAEAIRSLAPNRAIIIAADNDQFTDGNPGVAFAKAAAFAVGGFLAVPQFASLDGKPTDANDLHAREGLEAVREQIMESLLVEPTQAPEPEPEPEQAPEPAVETEAEKKARLKAKREAKKAETLAAAAARAAEYAANPDMYDPTKYFTVLGHDRLKIFVYSHEMKLVVSHGLTHLNKHSMLQIARPDFWQKFCINPQDQIPWDICENWLFKQGYDKGFYDPSKTRGRGAWMDGGRIVYHFGNMLMVDGVETPVTAIKSKFVYEQGQKLPAPADEPLSDAEGRSILELAKMFRWEKSGSAVLLTGWVALAPICGALKWRPHAWITGAAGSGKSTILNDFVRVLMAGTAIFSQGNSTEAGIRQKLQSDALPVLFDESEQGDDKAEARVQNVISLARQSSSESGAKTYKGTANGEGTHFLIRSMFCLCSIQVNIKNDADRDRLTVMALRPRRETGEADRWPETKEALYNLGRDDDLPARLMRRALTLLPTTLKNIEVFAEAAAKRFGSQREGDQYGTLIAGAWSLCSSAIATPEQAAAMIERYDWSEYIEHTETDDATKALSAVLETKLRLPQGQETTVHELISVVFKKTDSLEHRKLAKDMLRRRGIVVHHPVKEYRTTHFFVAFCAAERMRAEMGNSFVPDFKGQIGRYKDSVKPENPVSFPGGNKRGVLIPLSALMQDEGTAECLAEDEPYLEEHPF